MLLVVLQPVVYCTLITWNACCDVCVISAIPVQGDNRPSLLCGQMAVLVRRRRVHGKNSSGSSCRSISHCCQSGCSFTASFAQLMAIVLAQRFAAAATPFLPTHSHTTQQVQYSAGE